MLLTLYRLAIWADLLWPVMTYTAELTKVGNTRPGTFSFTFENNLCASAVRHSANSIRPIVAIAGGQENGVDLAEELRSAGSHRPGQQQIHPF